MQLQTKRKTKRENQKNILIVDGLNVIKHPKGESNLHNIDYVRIWAKNNGVSPLFILPGFKKFKKRFQEDDDVLLLDPRIYDDIAILAYARELDTAILSNDRFREFQTMFYDLDFNRVFPYKIANGNLATEATDFFFFKQSNFVNLSKSDIILGATH